MREIRATWAANDLFARGGAVSLRVISLHDHVMNFQADEWGHLLMLADPGMYRGPASAGLSRKDFQALRIRLRPGDAASFHDGAIELRDIFDLRLSLAAAERMNFSVPLSLSLDRAALSLPAVAEAMAELSAPHLCSCLLAASGVVACDPFARTLAREFPRLIHALAQGGQTEFEDASSRLVGLGYGSTPTGDDLIHGALVALHYMSRATRSGPPVPSLPPALGARTTPLGAHMLEMGRRGLSAGPLRDFALNLLAGEPLDPTFAGLGRMGSDSGCNMAVGFYLMTLEFASSEAWRPVGQGIARAERSGAPILTPSPPSPPPRRGR